MLEISEKCTPTRIPSHLSTSKGAVIIIFIEDDCSYKESIREVKYDSWNLIFDDFKAVFPRKINAPSKKSSSTDIEGHGHVTLYQ